MRMIFRSVNLTTRSGSKEDNCSMTPDSSILKRVSRSSMILSSMGMKQTLGRSLASKWSHNWNDKLVSLLVEAELAEFPEAIGAIKPLILRGVNDPRITLQVNMLKIPLFRFTALGVNGMAEFVVDRWSPGVGEKLVQFPLPFLVQVAYRL